MNNTSSLTRRKWIMLFFAVITLACGFVRVYYSWDHDQSYLILMAERIAHGKVLFRDLWDLHQTGALPAAPLYALYEQVLGTTEGIGVYLRFCALLVQYACAYAVWVVLKKHYPPFHAFLLAVFTAVFLPRGSTLIEYSTTSTWSLLLCALILLDLWKTKDVSHARGKAALAGFCYALSVFAYPTMILSVPYFFWLLWCRMPFERKTRHAMTYRFFGVCLFCVALLAGYLCMHVPLPEIPELFRAILQSGDHSGMFLFLKQPGSILKSLMRTAGLLGAAAIIALPFRRRASFGTVWFSVYSVLITVMIIGLNLTGIRPSGPVGLLERYIGLVLLGIVLRIDRRDPELFFTFYLPGIAMYIGALAGSNLGLNENAMYLELSIFAVILGFLNIIGEKEYSFSWQSASLLVLLFGMVFSSTYFVRIDGTQPANIRDCTAVIESGPLEGIRVVPEKYAQIIQIEDCLGRYSDPDGSSLLISKEPIGYYFVNGDYDAASYAGTAVYNDQWTAFYSQFNHPLPDTLFIGKDIFKSPSEFYQTPFGAWIRPQYEELSDREEPYFILRKTLK